MGASSDRLRAVVIFGLALLLGCPDVLADDPVDGPWRLAPAIRLPQWLEVRGEQRTRYESLSNQFRSRYEGSDQGLFFRNLLRITARQGVPQATLELMDSRQALSDQGSPLTTGEVNAVEPIQAFLALNFTDVLNPGDTLFLQSGRFTMDIGSRRLVARNDYRNTTNNFTGFNAVWTTAGGSSVQGFWTLPIERLPSDQESLLDNDIGFDDENLETQFWGLVGTRKNLIGKAFGEAFFFGLHENDAGERQTRDRELYTVGGRFGAKPVAGRADFELEGAYQFGTSRPSASSTTDLKNSAYWLHGEIGRLFEGALKLHLALQFDYYSGDQDPSDDQNDRFDPLFGARRFDFGPTGIFGPFARTNLISPGYRITLVPLPHWDVMFAHRFYWLADSSDGLPLAGLQDPSGSSGTYVGTMPEVRVRYEAIPGNLSLETGAAYLIKGPFFDDAPGNNGEGDSLLVYVQSTLSF